MSYWAINEIFRLETGQKSSFLGKNCLRNLISGPKSESYHTLGAIELMPGDRHKIDLEVVDVDVDLADGLGGVGVKEYALLTA